MCGVNKYYFSGVGRLNNDRLTCENYRGNPSGGEETETDKENMSSQNSPYIMTFPKIYHNHKQFRSSALLSKNQAQLIDAVGICLELLQCVPQIDKDVERETSLGIGSTVEL